MRHRAAVFRRSLGLCLALGAALLAGAGRGAEARTNAGPARLKVSGYGVFGNLQLKRMLKTVELAGQKPQYFSPSFVEDSALLLLARIKRDGYLEPAIDIHLTLADGDRLSATESSLLEEPLPRPLSVRAARFQIHKGKLFYFDQLQFSGLKTIPEKKARGFFMETDTLLHPRRARIFTPERLRRGLSSLIESLDRQGYMDAAAETARLATNFQTGAVEADIAVREGPRYWVQSVREEVRRPDEAIPASANTFTPQVPYSRMFAQDLILALKTNEFHQGYPDAKVDIKTLHRQPGSNNVVNLDLLALVNTGPRVWIQAVEFEGRTSTRPWLMRRRARVRRGDLLDPVRVEEGRARLAQLGSFSSVSLDYEPESEHRRKVIYTVKSGKTLNVSLLFGYGSYELLRAGVEVERFNLWGIGHQLQVRGIQSFKSTSGELTYTVPEVVGRDIDLFLHGFGLRREEVSFTRLEYGGGLGAHKYFPSLHTDATLRYNYQILNALDTFPVVATEGLTNPAVGAFIADVKLDRLDNPLYPHRGYKVLSTVETATEYLGGQANYERIEVAPSWHLPLGGGRYLALSARHGFAVSFGSAQNNLPFNKRFFPGGQNSIRGYQEGEASPRNIFGQIIGAETYTLGTVEFEQALTPKWSLVAFSDSLGIARRFADYPFDTGLFSVGAGIRWATIIGPVRLEYGHNLNPRPGDPSGTLHFSLGYPF